jgi:hypothetical protein
MGDSMSTIINATTTNGVVIQPDNSGSLVLQTNNGTTALTISTAQNATFVGQATIPTINLTGGQITFPATQSSSANANTLDDYEEGTWTPIFTASTPGTFSTSYSAQVGAYNKIGNIVIASFIVSGTTTKGTASGDFLIGGLPFATANTGYDQFTGCIGFMNPVLPSSPIGLLTNNNSTNMYIGIAAAGTLGVSAVSNASYGVRGTIIYRASS